MPNTTFHETLKYLRQTSANTYELTEPHLLYLSGDQSQAYLNAMDDDAYSGTFHNATVEIIKNNLARFFPEDWQELSLIDLGPGYPDKSIPIADYFQSKGYILHHFIPIHTGIIATIVENSF